SLAGELNRVGAGLSLARSEAHRFRVVHSTMVGERLVLRRGLRALTVEAGWPRSPRDGVVRGGGLASALVGHFGNRRADEELLLVPVESETARWFVVEKTGARTGLPEEPRPRPVLRPMGLRRGAHGVGPPHGRVLLRRLPARARARAPSAPRRRPCAPRHTRLLRSAAPHRTHAHGRARSPRRAQGRGRARADENPRGD